VAGDVDTALPVLPPVTGLSLARADAIFGAAFPLWDSLERMEPYSTTGHVGVNSPPLPLLVHPSSSQSALFMEASWNVLVCSILESHPLWLRR
jgi:hypothetical protein